MERFIWTVELDTTIKKLYLEDKETFTRMSEITGISRNSIASRIQVLGISGRGRINTNEIFYPDKMDDAEVGYICGLIATDGSLNKYNSIEISLKSEDKETLEFIRERINPSVSVHEFTAFRKEDKRYGFKSGIRNITRYRASAPKFRKFLENMGITQNKTHNLSVDLNNKSLDFKRGFFAGVVAGDGCVSWGKTRSKYGIIITTQSKDFSEQLQSLAKELYDSPPPNINISKRGLHRIAWNSSNGISMAKGINLPFMMKRKKERLERYIESWT